MKKKKVRSSWQLQVLYIPNVAMGINGWSRLEVELLRDKSVGTFI